MPLLDHLGITVEDLPRAVAQFDPVEDDNGIRIEFMHNPPKVPAD